VSGLELFDKPVLVASISHGRLSSILPKRTGEFNMAKKKGSAGKKIAIVLLLGFVFLIIMGLIGSQIETDDTDQPDNEPEPQPEPEPEPEPAMTRVYFQNNCNIELNVAIVINSASDDSAYIPAGDKVWYNDVCNVGDPLEIGIIGDYHVEYFDISSAPETVTVILHQDGSVTWQ